IISAPLVVAPTHLSPHSLHDALPIFGPLAAPILVLIWFYLAALAVLIGAATNAAVRRLWPTDDYRGPIERAGEWWDRVRSDDEPDRKSTRLNSSHVKISYAVFGL